MDIRETNEGDWRTLKKIRLAALCDNPTAFGVTYQIAIANSDEQWKQCASAESHPKFWLAYKDEHAIGMIGAAVDQAVRYNLIAMWVEPKSRGVGVADCLVNIVKSDAINMGHKQIYLDVSPDNLRACQFYSKHGFIFIGEDKPLASHPNIIVHTMHWCSEF